jgi:hypothetical protein
LRADNNTADLICGRKSFLFLSFGFLPPKREAEGYVTATRRKSKMFQILILTEKKEQFICTRVLNDSENWA